MIQQWLKRCVVTALLWACLMPCCQLHAQDKAKSPAKAASKGHVHDKHDNDNHEEDDPVWHFVSENRLAIQIVSAVVLIAAAAYLGYRTIGRPKKNDGQPPPPGKAEEPK